LPEAPGIETAKQGQERKCMLSSKSFHKIIQASFCFLFTLKPKAQNEKAHDIHKI